MIAGSSGWVASGSRRLGKVGVPAACSCCGVVAGRMALGVLAVVVALGRWERAAALGGELELWCKFLVEGMVFGWAGRRAVGRVLVELDLVGLVLGGSMFSGGICLWWRWWCGRGSLLVVRLEDVVRCMFLLAVDMMALWFRVVLFWMCSFAIRYSNIKDHSQASSDGV